MMKFKLAEFLFLFCEVFMIVAMVRLTRASKLAVLLLVSLLIEERAG
jgi:hypothetical protein